MSTTIEQPDQGPEDPRERAIWEMGNRADEAAAKRRTAATNVAAIRAHLEREQLWEQRHAVLERYYREAAARLAGAPEMPPPTDIRRLTDRPGIHIGGQLVAPLHDSTEQLNAYLETVRSVHTEAWAEMTRIKELLRERQDTLATGEFAPEDQPQPDPLTATPAEESGAHAIVSPDAPAQLPARIPGQALAAARADDDIDPAPREGLCAACRTPVLRYGTGPWIHQATYRKACRDQLDSPTASPAETPETQDPGPGPDVRDGVVATFPDEGHADNGSPSRTRRDVVDAAGQWTDAYRLEHAQGEEQGESAVSHEPREGRTDG